jgi:aldehyde:ferredoxin oxidoreductase
LDDGAERKGPEYETIIGFGPNLGSTDLSAITRLGELCDSYGMDTISVSNTIGLAFLLYERGILDEAQCGGSLVWGDTSAAERLIHLMIRREGLGELLAQGSLALAQACGVPELAAHVKGLETPYHDPRGGTGVALSYATSPRGACHNQSHYYMVEIGQTMEDIGVMRFERQAGAEKAANVARHQDWLTVLNALVACIFANVDQETMCEMLNQVTGWRYAPQELMLAGERGWTLKRLINNRLGYSNQEDCLPEHLNQPLGEGGAAGFTIPFAEMLSAYYAVRGWEADTGRPGRSLLKRLDLEGI